MGDSDETLSQEELARLHGMQRARKITGAHSMIAIFCYEGSTAVAIDGCCDKENARAIEKIGDMLDAMIGGDCDPMAEFLRSKGYIVTNYAKQH